MQGWRRRWHTLLPILLVMLVGLVFVFDGRQAPNRVVAEELEADVRLEVATACAPVSRAAPTLLVSPGDVVFDEAREVVVDLPVLSNDLPDGALVGVGIAQDGDLEHGDVVAFDPDTMALRLGAPVVVGPGRWPIVVAFRPTGPGQLTLLGSMTMRAAAGYRPPDFTLEVSEDCPAT